MEKRRLSRNASAASSFQRRLAEMPHVAPTSGESSSSPPSACRYLAASEASWVARPCFSQMAVPAWRTAVTSLAEVPTTMKLST